MPFKELDAMGMREEFVLKALDPRTNRSHLCREYGISRKTGYKWIERYEERGLAGLEELSRAPKTSPLKVSGDVVAEVVRLRKTHGWGARKLTDILAHELGNEAPSERTVNRILVRSGFLQPARRRKRQKSNGPKKPPRYVATKPNDLWTVDFKGWWLAMDGDRCEPLTVRDQHSRFVLCIQVMPKTKTEEVQAVFEELFKKYGLPKAILTDNGPPWVTSQGKLGLTRLSVWWMTLGIQHLRTRPGKPSDNGAHERMHKDMAKDLEQFASLNRIHQQQACDRWRRDFNHLRPHEAIGMRRPAELYVRSEVEYAPLPTEHVYPEHFKVRRVNKRGTLSYRNKQAFLSWALDTQVVGLEELEPHVFDVWLGTIRLGTVDFRKKKPQLVAEKVIQETDCHP